MSTWAIPALIVGLVCLVAGAELLVRGAAGIASRLGIAPVIVGLTVVAFGTSAPELAVSISAVRGGSADVAFGNVVGSNIVNILLILGASAVVGGLAVSQRIIRLDVPLLFSASVAVLLMSLDGSIGRVDGIILFAGVVSYTGWLIKGARREPDAAVLAEYDESIDELDVGVVDKPVPFQAMLVAAGLGVLVAGSQLLVSSATDIAETIGVSDLVIGLTVVAVGTSLPEMATSMLAASRGRRDIAVGNVVGSCLFNLMCVLGASAVVSSDGIAVTDGSLRLDLPVMIAATAVLVPIFWNGFRITRLEGVVLIGFYLLYVVYLVLDSEDHAASSAIGMTALIAGGIVIVVLAVTGFQGFQRHQANLAEAR